MECAYDLAIAHANCLKLCLLISRILDGTAATGSFDHTISGAHSKPYSNGIGAEENPHVAEIWFVRVCSASAFHPALSFGLGLLEQRLFLAIRL